LQARALQQIGVLGSAKALCTLLSVGAHRLLPVRERSTFSDIGSLDFWLGLVTLWTLGMHELVEEEFHGRVKDVANPGELSIGALKKFPRTFAKVAPRQLAPPAARHFLARPLTSSALRLRRRRPSRRRSCRPGRSRSWRRCISLTSCAVRPARAELPSSQAPGPRVPGDSQSASCCRHLHG